MLALTSIEFFGTRSILKISNCEKEILQRTLGLYQITYKWLLSYFFSRNIDYILGREF